MKRVNPFKGYPGFQKVWLNLIFISLLSIITGSQAFAHRVILFAYVEEDTVFTESYFSGGKRCQNSLIEVFDRTGKKLLEGKTDKAGEFSFKMPVKTDLRLVLTASMGHRAEYIITAGEISDTIERKLKKSENQPAQKGILEAGITKDKEKITAEIAQVDLKEVKSIIEDALDERLRPLMKLVAKSHDHRVSFTEVIGGIGYIFGIMGIVMYLKSRKR